MKRFRWLSAVVALTVLAGCTPSVNPDQEVVQESDQAEVEMTIIPSFKLNDTYYKTLIPYKESASRGLVVSNINTKYDMKEVETGLMRLSQNEFNTEDFYFQEGQYLSEEMVRYWLARENQTTDKGPEYKGLNPSSLDANGNELDPTTKAKEAPVYLAHLVEQNYLTKTDKDKVTLGGISIGLALNSIYYYQKEQYGEYYEQKIDDATLEKIRKEMAQEVVNRLRQRSELADVPIVIGLFKQQARNSIVPGTYFAYSTAEANSSKLGEWTNINEEYVTLPMSSPADKYRDLNKEFQNFKMDIDEYFSNFTSVIGEAFYQENRLSSLDIEVPIQFYGTAEVIGFAQYLTGVMLKQLPSDVQITVSINSSNGAEALIKKEANEDEPFVHIYE